MQPCPIKSLVDNSDAALSFVGVRVELNSRLIHRCSMKTDHQVKNLELCQ